MVAITVVGELGRDMMPTKLSLEAATLGRSLMPAATSGARGLIVDAAAQQAAETLSWFLPSVDLDSGAGHNPTPSERAAIAAAYLHEEGYVIIPASPDGRDLAGALSAITGAGILANATAVAWDENGPIAQHNVLGGRFVTRSVFTSNRGIITLRAGAAHATRMQSPGAVSHCRSTPGATIASITTLDLVNTASESVAIEDARVVVAGGRGVGSVEGFHLVEELAAALGGAVGASRAAVDSGWIEYSQQVGQTGKIVKPKLYLALGISGAIQHKVGMQTAETIVAINHDPAAPMREFADLFVLGDLFEIGRELLRQLRGRVT